ncbi:MAG: diaminopimelate decarboxylase [Clostridium perfringens]|uniref:Diaminopimelate decarboxylase n=1 Tax=Clostridium perfringens TaxID=1502 RepID=A0AAW9J1E0_CLOPF|nr:diaminopimelate decarboxylase [Clostridium perfringens]EGS5729523.1 diaminopimelate decarboxylase [Clostridium perfringens]EHK2363429.1 diaminopimelate decarboxylase [Clostridium perfringens]EHK2401804.1 diaminopimelate decarboxylase [Clostridium perfringens]EJT5927424.1 diaminopimelate decarboxylase [Clostridium perfringens]EJT6481979.1 diaminopimelate decarboxylase [Clostridium perfringens]
MKLFGSMKVEGNELYVGGVKASALSKEYGTPLYVIDEELVRSNCRRYYNAMKCEERGNRVTYAGKAFINMSMCNLVNEENLYLDVVSGGELYTAYKAGFPLERIYFHGNNKSDYEIDLGVRLGIGRFIVDNIHELEVLNSIAQEYGRVQKVYLRITPGVEAHTHEYIKTGQLDSKFGFPVIGDTVYDAIKRAMELEYIELNGLHCHIGSQIFDLEPFEDTTEIMLNLINDIKETLGYEIKELDLGGGFGIYYTEGDKPKEIEEYCSVIINKADEICRKLNMNVPILSIEPGRSIVGNAGLTLYTVGAIKEIPNIRKYVSVDGGMSDNIRPALYSANYESLIANRVFDNSKEIVTVAGKCCESGDVLLNSIEMPRMETGDILAIMSTGAYGHSMANNYNRIPKAAVVSVRNGISKVMCKRETYEDLLRNECF